MTAEEKKLGDTSRCGYPFSLHPALLAHAHNGFLHPHMFDNLFTHFCGAAYSIVHVWVQSTWALSMDMHNSDAWHRILDNNNYLHDLFECHSPICSLANRLSDLLSNKHCWKCCCQFLLTSDDYFSISLKHVIRLIGLYRHKTVIHLAHFLNFWSNDKFLVESMRVSGLKSTKNRAICHQPLTNFPTTTKIWLISIGLSPFPCRPLQPRVTRRAYSQCDKFDINMRIVGKKKLSKNR